MALSGRSSPAGSSIHTAFSDSHPAQVIWMLHTRNWRQLVTAVEVLLKQQDRHRVLVLDFYTGSSSNAMHRNAVRYTLARM